MAGSQLSGAGVMRSTANNQLARAGAVPRAPLHFHTNKQQEAEALVLHYHYSRRVPANVQFIGTLHESGGLFGDQGECVAAAFFSIPPTRWAEPVLELSRLVRRDDVKPPLTKLISLCCRQLKADGADLLISFADKTQGHEGTVYRAAGWFCAGDRKAQQDGIIVNGIFVPGRSANSMWGTRSPAKLKEMFPHKEVEPHWDMGKRLFWKPLGRRGAQKAVRLSLKKQAPNQ